MPITTRELRLYWARRNLESLLVDAIIDVSRLDRLNAAIDRSAARMKAIARHRKPRPYRDEDLADAAE